MEVLGALASILSVWLVTGVLVFEAINRIMTPEPVNGKGEQRHVDSVLHSWALA